MTAGSRLNLLPSLRALHLRQNTTAISEQYVVFTPAYPSSGSNNGHPFHWYGTPLPTISTSVKICTLSRFSRITPPFPKNGFSIRLCAPAGLRSCIQRTQVRVSNNTILFCDTQTCKNAGPRQVKGERTDCTPLYQPARATCCTHALAVWYQGKGKGILSTRLKRRLLHPGYQASYLIPYQASTYQRISHMYESFSHLVRSRH